MISDHELAVQTNLTKWFRDADIESIVLNRTTEISDGAGGIVRESVGLPPQPFRLIPQSDRLDNIRQNNDGQVELIKFVIMAMPDADIQQFDWFVFRNEQYLVQSVYRRTNGYEIKADVILRG